MTDDFTPMRRSARPLLVSDRPGRPIVRALRRARDRIADERGITLMELLVSMSLMLLVAGALSTVIASASRAEVRTSRSFQAQVQGRIALNKLRRELHCASAITVRSSSGSAVSTGTAGAQIAITLGGYCPPTASRMWSPSPSTSPGVRPRVAR